MPLGEYYEDLSKYPPDERLGELEHFIAGEYLYPSYAYVELPEKVTELVEKAKEVKIDSAIHTIVIDGRKYDYFFEDEVHFDPYLCEDEEECERWREDVMSEAEKLREKAEKYNREMKDGCYWGLFENANEDFYVASLLAVCPVKV